MKQHNARDIQLMQSHISLEQKKKDGKQQAVSILFKILLNQPWLQVLHNTRKGWEALPRDNSNWGLKIRLDGCLSDSK